MLGRVVSCHHVIECKSKFGVFATMNLNIYEPEEIQADTK